MPESMKSEIDAHGPTRYSRAGRYTAIINDLLAFSPEQLEEIIKVAKKLLHAKRTLVSVAVEARQMMFKLAPVRGRSPKAEKANAMLTAMGVSVVEASANTEIVEEA